MEVIETLGQVLGNSHFEAWVAGPLVGAIAGLIFAAVATQQSDGNQKETRQRVQRDQATAVDRQEIHHHHYYERTQRTSSGGDDAALPLMAGVGIAMMVALLLFAAYVPTIAWSLYFGITSVAMFCLTTLMFMLLSGRFGFWDWVNNAAVPLLVSMACFYLAVRARQNITDDVIAYAQGVLGNEPLTFQKIVPASITFFKAMGFDYALWLLLDMVAFVLICLCAIFAFGTCLNFVALSNLAATGSGTWRFVERRTRRFTGTTGIIAPVLMLTAAGLCSTGLAYQWIQQLHH